ncbi:MMPL family transporter [Promicromonospora iranensis]|uniref:RND superfamily putative drug exporter n=1 Tax=Promicromonospora iranensis TaxID=1105144 RepID=A0ABU2CU33_9MICO|nr:MMPL family transporter [Promicromonospora iranensis]MDR7384864.1 RND superfamily putative drug exporter [Promicromonospora iranensis]
MLGRLVTHRPWRVLVTSALVLLASFAVAATTVSSLSLNRYEAPGSESAAARAALAERFGTGSPNVALLVSPATGTVDDDAVAGLGQELTDAVARFPGVGDAWSYWSPAAPDTLAGQDRRQALVLAWAPGDADHVRGEVLPALETDVVERFDGAEVAVTLGGGDEIFRIVAGQARTDFLRAELIVVPLVLALLWLVYRRFVPALATLAVGLFAAAGSLALIRLVVTFTEVSTFAANVSLVMGIGLGVDYSLFMIYRYREEVAAGHGTTEAVRRTVAGAGRTVLFSGLTVAAALAVLFVFPFPFLSSFAYAGIAVVLCAVLGATVALPAILHLAGPRMLRPARADRIEDGFWYRVSATVMRRPIVTGGAGLLVLLLLGAPTLGLTFGSPDDRVLNDSGQPVRAMYDTIRADFAAEDADALFVVAPDASGAGTGSAEAGSPESGTRAAAVPDRALHDYAASLSQIPGVARVDSAAGAFAAGERIGPAGPFGADRFGSGAATRLSVLPTSDRLANDPVGLVRDVRGADAPFEVLVGGYPAELADYRDGIVDRLPLVGLLILAVTFVVLFVMTGSVVAPLTAMVLNLLSLSVMFGVVVWGFQDGALAGLLGFTPTGVVEPSILLLMFCIAYGLSMDYEVFLLARVQEEYARTGDVVGSVPTGIARSAPLVTAAALILAASFAVYASSEVSFMQQLGIGMALAVAVDATLIRGVLVPAALRLTGRASWWAPGPLGALHDRFGPREHPVTPAAGHSPPLTQPASEQPTAEHLTSERTLR